MVDETRITVTHGPRHLSCAAPNMLTDTTKLYPKIGGGAYTYFVVC